ncbi:MAG TPA: enoyl-CoA hydratase/isomerase family protein [Pyrinomonadaceae bacterium]|nr:enoyl-CoA hydratase/isomerase family protein [Pyrinomonadaceae bacterium]
MTEPGNTVLYRVDDGVAHLTLNRPDKRNALNDALISDLKAALGQGSRDESIRAIVLSGAGRDFCSGADLKALEKISKASVAGNIDDARSLMELFMLMRALPLPVIAAVRGKALAGGSGLASACDIVLASADARFGYPEVKIGFVPAMVMAILRRNISEKRAFELVTRGEEISAEEGKRIGLVNQVFTEADFENEVSAYAKRFSTLSKSAVALTKGLLYQMDTMAFDQAIATGVDVNVIARMSKDCQAGVAKFLKKA